MGVLKRALRRNSRRPCDDGACDWRAKGARRGGGNTRQRRGRKAVYRAVIYLRPRLNGCRRYELPGSRGPMDLCASSPLLLRYIEWVREPVRLRDRAPPVKDTGKIYRNPMRRKRADICVSRAARKRSKNRPVDTKNKGSSRLRVVVSRPGPSLALPARTSRGAINRRKQSLIFRNFNSQSVNRARGSLRDEQNVHSVLRENLRGFKRRETGQRVSIYAARDI